MRQNLSVALGKAAENKVELSSTAINFIVKNIAMVEDTNIKKSMFSTVGFNIECSTKADKSISNDSLVRLIYLLDEFDS